jgi:exopolyphosphatase/guanosine-5'-triphosphate,3'-diphosphate pyrophosphatase
MVIDIGGGSTEIIQGRGLQPLTMESLYMGCVSATAASFGDGKLNRRNFRAARQAARLELEPVRARFVQRSLARVVGASGTVRAAHDVLTLLGRARKGVTVNDLEYLIDCMIGIGRVSDLRLPGLPADRAAVFPGGVAILVEVLSCLDVDRMIVAEGALREGILYDMVGRLTDEDARVSTVRAMQARFRVDTRQAARVSATALSLLRQTAAGWELHRDADRNLLTWAAALHEIGLDIAHAHHHHHGGYLLENADMPGFARDEQAVLAAIVRGHRRKFGRELFANLPAEWRTRALRLTVLLRLAVLFNRSRRSRSLPALRLAAGGRNLRLWLSSRWLKASPLTEADLEQERRYLGGADLLMRVFRRKR